MGAGVVGWGGGPGGAKAAKRGGEWPGENEGRLLQSHQTDKHNDMLRPPHLAAVTRAT